MLRQKRFQLSNYEVKFSFGIKMDGKPQVKIRYSSTRFLHAGLLLCISRAFLNDY